MCDVYSVNNIILCACISQSVQNFDLIIVSSQVIDTSAEQ